MPATAPIFLADAVIAGVPENWHPAGDRPDRLPEPGFQYDAFEGDGTGRCSGTLRESADHPGHWWAAVYDLTANEQRYTRRPIRAEAALAWLKFAGLDVRSANWGRSPSNAVVGNPFAKGTKGAA